MSATSATIDLCQFQVWKNTWQSTQQKPLISSPYLGSYCSCPGRPSVRHAFTSRIHAYYRRKLGLNRIFRIGKFSVWPYGGQKGSNVSPKSRITPNWSSNYVKTINIHLNLLVTAVGQSKVKKGHSNIFRIPEVKFFPLIPHMPPFSSFNIPDLPWPFIWPVDLNLKIGLQVPLWNFIVHVLTEFHSNRMKIVVTRAFPLKKKVQKLSPRYWRKQTFWKFFRLQSVVRFS